MAGHEVYRTISDKNAILDRNHLLFRNLVSMGITCKLSPLKTLIHSWCILDLHVCTFFKFETTLSISFVSKFERDLCLVSLVFGGNDITMHNECVDRRRLNQYVYAVGENYCVISKVCIRNIYIEGIITVCNLTGWSKITQGYDGL